MTKLWLNEDVGESDDAFAGLEAKGYVEAMALSGAGRLVREAIEDETNERSQVSFDALDDEQAGTFLAALRRVPGER